MQYKTWRRLLLGASLAVLSAFASGQAVALTAPQALAMAAQDSEGRIAAMQTAVSTPDARIVPYLQALHDDAVHYTDTHAFIVQGGQASDPVTGQPVQLPDSAQEVVNNTYMRGQIEAALAVLQLQSPEVTVRLHAAKAMRDAANSAQLPLIEQALVTEKNAAIRHALEQARTVAMLGSEQPTQRVMAVQALSAAGTPDAKTLLSERLAEERDPNVIAAIAKGVSAIDNNLAWGERLGVVFSGLSLGSVLLLAALGLAIT